MSFYDTEGNASVSCNISVYVCDAWWCLCVRDRMSCSTFSQLMIFISTRLMPRIPRSAGWYSTFVEIYCYFIITAYSSSDWMHSWNTDATTTVCSSCVCVLWRLLITTTCQTQRQWPSKSSHAYRRQKKCLEISQHCLTVLCTSWTPVLSPRPSSKCHL